MERRSRHESHPHSRLEASAESIEALRKLQAYQEQGYLFHGSKEPAEELEPRQAHDTDATRVSGNQEGIYAIDRLDIPVFMALKAPQTGGNFHSGYDGTPERLHVYGENTILTPGYIHVLPRSAFEEFPDGRGGQELIARSRVRAVDIVPVSPDIVRLLPGLTIDLANGSVDRAKKAR